MPGSNKSNDWSIGDVVFVAMVDVKRRRFRIVRSVISRVGDFLDADGISPWGKKTFFRTEDEAREHIRSFVGKRIQETRRMLDSYLTCDADKILVENVANNAARLT